jgi:hypothetical protein
MKSDGTYCDNQKSVALINLASFWLFWFNLITSIPVSWMEWSVLQVLRYSVFLAALSEPYRVLLTESISQQFCSETDTLSTADSDSSSASLVGNFGVLRIVKPLRLFKLLRILRISKSFK